MESSNVKIDISILNTMSDEELIKLAIKNKVIVDLKNITSTSKRKELILKIIYENTKDKQ